MNIIDFNSILPGVIDQLGLVENKQMSNKTNKRFGSKGSLSIDLKKATWYDHENQIGGGLLDLIEQQTGDNAWDWLRKHGFVSEQMPKANIILAPTSNYKERNEVYIYKTAAGDPLYRKIRSYDSHGVRKFAQERFDKESGKWLSGLKIKDNEGNVINEVTPTIYNLPALINQPNDTIYFVEGERNVNDLTALGLLATTSGSANSWQDQFASFFIGREVIVFADNDAAGIAFQQSVIASLNGKAKSLKAIDLAKHWREMPVKGDISDFIASGGSLSDLQNIIEQTAYIQPLMTIKPPRLTFSTIGELIDKTQEIDWLIKNYITSDSLTCLFAQPGSGKSVLALDWAARIASGDEWYGCRVKQGTVAYIAGEGTYGLVRRLQAWQIDNDISLKNSPLYLSSASAPIDTVEGLDEVITAIDATGSTPRLIVLDTLARSISGNENDSEAMNAFIAACDTLRHRYQGASILIVHHTGHSVTDRARGSSVLNAAMDTSYSLTTDSDIRCLCCTKAKDFKPTITECFTLKEIDLGNLDEDGYAVTSVVLEPTNATTKSEKLTKTQKLGINSLLAAISNQEETAELSQWRSIFYAVYNGDSPDAKKKAFQRVRNDLETKGIIKGEHDIYSFINIDKHKTIDATTIALKYREDLKKKEAKNASDFMTKEGSNDNLT